MVAILATVALPSTSGLPEDDVLNDFVFDIPGPFDDTAADALTDELDDFYNVVRTTPIVDRAVQEFIADSVSRAANGVTVGMYDITANLDGSPHGSPLFVRSFTLGAVTAGLVNFPGEVAVVNGIHADLTGIPETAVNPTPPPATLRPASSRRGRQYIGPLNVRASDQTTGNRPMVNQELRLALTEASEALLAAVPGWSVWSRRDATLYTVEGGYVDDAFDTVRKRGQSPSSRTIWP